MEEFVLEDLLNGDVREVLLEALAPIKGTVTADGNYKIVMYQTGEDVYKVVTYKKEVIDNNEEEIYVNWIYINSESNLSESEARKEFSVTKSRLEKQGAPSPNTSKADGVTVNVTVNVNKD